MAPLILAAIFGLVAGSYAHVLADGFGADPDEHRKEAGQAFARAVRTVPLPRRPYLTEGATAVAAVLVTWRLLVSSAGGWLVAVWLYAVVAGVALAVIDWRTRRLPDVITLSSYPIVAVLLAPSGQLGSAAIWGLALGGFYAVMWFIRPDGIGLGDVKLAGVIGMLTGAVGYETALTAGLGGFLLGAVYAIGLLVTRRGTRTSEFPFGPFMLVAALMAVLARA
jgi:leader peptidase (prepilin peptidase) / N-methyltransferase